VATGPGCDFDAIISLKAGPEKGRSIAFNCNDADTANPLGSRNYSRRNGLFAARRIGEDEWLDFRSDEI
jgi:hypothetical protein